MKPGEMYFRDDLDTADGLDAYVDSLAGAGAPTTDAGAERQAGVDNALVVRDLLALSEATPLRPGFAEELRERLLREAKQRAEPVAPVDPVKPERLLPWWRKFLLVQPGEPGEAAGSSSRRLPFGALGLAGAATVLLVVVAAAAFLASPADPRADEILAQARRAYADSRAFGLQSYHGTVSGRNVYSGATSSYEQPFTEEVWFQAPDKRRREIRTVLGGPTTAGPQPTPSAFIFIENGPTGLLYHPDSGTVQLIASQQSGEVPVTAGADLESVMATAGQYYDARLGGEGLVAGRKTFILDLTINGLGRQQTNLAPRIRAEVDQQTYVQLAGATLDAQGNTPYEWAYTSFEANAAVDAALFVYIPPADATIIWQRPMTFEEQAQRWQEVARQAEERGAFQVYMPVFTPQSLQPEGPRLLPEPEPGLEQSYRAGMGMPGLRLVERRIGQSDAGYTTGYEHAQSIQLGEFTGVYAGASERYQVLVLRKDTTEIVFSSEGGVSKDDFLALAGSLQPVGRAGQNPTPATPRPVVFATLAPAAATATAARAAIAVLTQVPAIITPQPSPAVLQQVRIVLEAGTRRDSGGTPVAARPGDFEQASEIVEQRLAAIGVADVRINRSGDTRLVIELRTWRDPRRLAETLATVGEIEFIDAGSTYLPEGTLVCTSSGCPAVGAGATVDGAASPTPYAGPVYPVVIAAGEIDGASAAAVRDPNTGSWLVELTLQGAAPKKLEDFTREHVGTYLSIVLDKEVVSSPSIRAPVLGSQFMITNLSETQANDLVLLLRLGTLPVPFSVLSVEATPVEQ